MADAAIIQNNKILNLLDPPKDLQAEGSLTVARHGGTLAPWLKQLFWPDGSGQEPTGFTAVGDTKDAIKKNLGAESSQPNYKNKPLTAYLLNKANRLRILREAHSTGSDGRPSDLFVSQDSGPGVEKIVKGAHIIITPGTIMDPASKTKEAAHDYDVTNLINSGPPEFRTLPRVPYIQNTGMENVITGDIKITSEANGYRIKIPTNLGGVAVNPNGRDGPGMINALLDKATFKKKTGPDNPDGAFFEGNAEKNAFIADNYANAAKENEIKKYILVKELGDTLQVVWLKYVMSSERSPYKIEKTVLITGDTVVWYRCIINKVPVIITYKGETNWFRATDNDAAMIAAFKQTIQAELLGDNEAVIQIFEEVLALVATKTDAEVTWINGITWSKNQYEAARNYLSAFIRKLKNLNKDAALFLEKVATIEAAKAAASRYHFANPFVKKTDIWKTNNKVLTILPELNIKFNANTFGKPSIIVDKLGDTNQFISVADVVEGGGQRGGGRRSEEAKVAAAQAATTKQAAIDYVTASIADWNYGSDVDQVIPQSAIDRRDEAKTKRDTVHIVGNKDRFEVHTNECWLLFQNNKIVKNNKQTLTDHVFYLLVREYYPQVFTYGSMMRQAMVDISNNIELGSSHYTAAHIGYHRTMAANFKEVTIDLQSKFAIEYTQTANGIMVVTGVDGGPIPASATAAATSTATKKAVFLAHKFITYFDYLPSQDIADFIAYAMNKDNNLLTEEEIRTFNGYLTHLNAYGYAAAQTVYDLGQGGGGKQLDLFLGRAMDNYEVYYNLYVQAAYEDRTVTDTEFQREVRRIEQKIRTDRISVKKSNSRSQGIDPFALAKLMKGQPLTGMSPQLRHSLSPAFSAALPRSVNSFTGEGGKSRRRKTQKKRKSSKKQRKTRRSKK